MTYSVYDRWTVIKGKYALVYRNLSYLDANEEAKNLNHLNETRLNRLYDTKQKSESYQQGVKAYWDGDTEVWNNPFHCGEPQILWELGFSEAEAEVTGTPVIPF